MASDAGDSLALFLCGDVMTGRGVDQILPHPGDPNLYEDYARDARDYVELAERAHGPIPRPVGPDYIWGDALAVLASRQPVARIINLETSVTTHARPLPKGINYRMHPDNIACLTVAGVDCCALANNHVLDWGTEGLTETIATLDRHSIRHTGAGADATAATAPAIVECPGGARLLVFSCATSDCGVPASWSAGEAHPGVWRLPNLSATTVDRLAEQVHAWRRPGDRVILSIHWGGNWGFDVSGSQRRFARAVVDRAGIDLVHGHSSHHVRGFEIYTGRLILYGCGDFLTDYEGIGGHEEFRCDLALMYFPCLDPASGRLLSLDLVPVRTRRMRIERADAGDRQWLLETVRRECARLAPAPEVRDEPDAFAVIHPTM